MDNETTPAERLRAHLLEMSKGFRIFGAGLGAWMMSEFVAREGAACIAQALPAGYLTGMPKLCFANSAKLVRRRKGLAYCEGYISHPKLPIPMHHAWAIDAERRVIDVTLRNPEEHAYLGVTIPDADYRAATANKERGFSASVFLDAFECVRADYMLRRCPALQELMQ